MAKRAKITTKDVNRAAPTAKTTAAEDQAAPPSRESLNVYLLPDVKRAVDYRVFVLKDDAAGVSRSIWIEAALQYALDDEAARAAVEAAAIRKAENKWSGGAAD